MKKDDLVQAVYEAHGGISYSEAHRLVDLFWEIIRDRLCRGEKVLLSGFGCFRVVTRKDRKGVNPQTGKSMVINGRKGITFRPSKYLKSI